MKGMSKLSNKVFVFVVIAVVLIIAAFSITLYSNTNKSVEETIGNQTVNIGENVATQLDAEKFKDILDHPEESELYWRLRDELNDIREKNGVLYLYTMTVVEKGGTAKMLVDGSPKEVDDSPIGSEASTINDDIMKAVNKDGYYHSGIENFEGYGDLLSAVVPMKNADGKTIGLIGVDIAADDVKSVKSEILQSALPIAIGTILLIGVALIFFIRRYTNSTLQPLTILQEAVVQFADGDIVGAEQKLESVKFKGNNEITRFEVAFSESLTKLKGTFTEVLHTSEELKNVIDQISASTQTVHTSNNEIADSILHIASGSEQQKVNNGEVMNAMEEMVVGIQRMADSTSNISQASIDMTTLVESGVKESEMVVEQIKNVERSVLGTADHVTEMAEKFRSIEEMVEVITSIADQTNLLALNAAIEAARAGESGKGFAVVADEVRKLAEMSRNSAEDIREHLQNFSSTAESVVKEMNESSHEVKEGSVAVSSIGKKLNAILQSVQHVNEEIQEDSAVVEQMSASSEEVLASTEQMNGIVVNNAKRATRVASASDQQVQIIEELSNISEYLASNADEMMTLIKQFKVK